MPPRKSELSKPGETTLLAQTAEGRAAAPNLLENLLPETRNAVMRLARRIDFVAGDVIFQQGDTHAGIFLIEQGIVRSFYCSEDGRELTLGFWSDGHYVGAPHMFGGGEHAWTSEARGPTTCLYLPASGLKQLSRQHIDLANALLEALVKKSESYCALLQLLATHSMKVRLARLLLLLRAQESAIGTTFTHRELAGMIGSTRQWVSQTLLIFEDRQLIEKRPGGAIRVLNPAGLSAVR